MAHLESHPDSGKYFRIRLAEHNPKAGYDAMIQGQVVRLIDWADRIEQDSQLDKRKKEVAVMFYAHRCAPHLEVVDPVPLSWLSLESVLYCSWSFEYEGQRRESIVLLNESELIMIDHQQK